MSSNYHLFVFTHEVISPTHYELMLNCTLSAIAMQMILICLSFAQGIFFKSTYLFKTSTWYLNLLKYYSKQETKLYSIAQQNTSPISPAPE